MAIKLKKTLYVGLGGNGVSALLKIKKCFVDSYGEYSSNDRLHSN